MGNVGNITPRHVTLTGVMSGVLRSASYDGREHLVVPVIMLKGDIVVRPMNSHGPEFVPASALAQGVTSWNGRPILPDHPTAPDGTAIPANTPTTLERHAFGQIFNARIDGNDLHAEAWLDVQRALKIGGNAQRVVERCKAMEPVEVSVGAVVMMEERAGNHNGEPYEYVWHTPIPDHLAMLPEGVTGACSVEMGCGAPRLMRAASLLSTNSEDLPMPTLRGLLQSLAAVLSPAALAQEKGKSDTDVRGILDRELFNTVPAYMGILEVYPDSKTVIYMTGMYGENVQYWRRSYKLYNDSLTLGSDSEEVKMDMVYTPAAASSTVTTEVQTAACGCDKSQVDKSHVDKSQSPSGEGQSQEHPAPVPTAAPTELEGVHMDTAVKDAVGRLLGAGRFKEEHRSVLESMSACQLKALEDSTTTNPNTPVPTPSPTPSPAPTPTPTPTPKAEEPKELSEEEQIAALPAALRSLITQAKETDARERTALMATLAKQQAFTAAQLQAKSTDELRQLASLVQPEVDFSAARLLPLTPDGKDIYRNPPKPYDLALAAEKKGA